MKVRRTFSQCSAKGKVKKRKSDEHAFVTSESTNDDDSN